MNRYDNRLRVLMEEYETLISRENEKILPGNGIFERYKYPILTAAHTPLEWRYDFNPETNPYFANSLAVIPLQLFGYYVSIGKGLDVDKPRNLAKSVTVE